MRFLLIKKKGESKLTDFANACKVSIDYAKYQSSRSIYLTGLNNFTLFQKFSNFKWPAWINAATGASRGNTGFIPHMLVNSSMRDCLYFTNFLSSEGLFVDPAGMMSPTYDHWSIEVWIVAGKQLYRPAGEWDRVKQERDVKNSIINSTWDTSTFTLRHTLYGARSTVDEAVVETECFIKERKHASLLFVVRPYDQFNLGGLESVEFISDSYCLNINGRKSVCFSDRPDYIVSGGGELCRDINPQNEDNQTRSTSRYGMAALGLGFTLKKGDNRFVFRLALDPRGGLTSGKYDFVKVKNDFTSFTSIRIRNGANVSLPDKLLQNWFYGSKISLLNLSPKNLHREDGTLDCRKAWCMIFGANRMGYFTESLGYIDYVIQNFGGDDRNITFDEAIDTCYVLHAIADYFIHVRDTGFLQGRFDFIKRKATVLYNYSRKLKKPGSRSRNSLPHYSIAEEHPFDAIIITHALSQYSYLARCLGIFGDESKYKRESDRIAGIAVKFAFDEDADSPENEFIYYNLYAGFPFRVDAVTDAALKNLLNRMRRYFSDMPLFVKSLGWDIFSTLVAANNLLLMKDAKGYETIENLFRTKNRTYTLPEYMNPASGRANWGEGASMVVSAMTFATIRNLLFIDHPERLDIFPLPQPDWFKPGNEIKIEDAPSRFGQISLRMVSTTHEIQLHFDKLPKFVPPDIMINLPYKTKIKHEDDFILKREGDTSVVINGWPSIVRFIRK